MFCSDCAPTDSYLKIIKIVVPSTNSRCRIPSNTAQPWAVGMINEKLYQHDINKQSTMKWIVYYVSVYSQTMSKAKVDKNSLMSRDERCFLTYSKRSLDG